MTGQEACPTEQHSRNRKAPALFIPTAYDGATPTPLVIVLHGAGGDENDFFDGYGESPLKPRGGVQLRPILKFFAGHARPEPR